jgi:hypothetical protein
MSFVTQEEGSIPFLFLFEDLLDSLSLPHRVFIIVYEYRVAASFDVVTQAYLTTIHHYLHLLRCPKNRLSRNTNIKISRHGTPSPPTSSQIIGSFLRPNQRSETRTAPLNLEWLTISHDVYYTARGYLDRRPFIIASIPFEYTILPVF